MTTPNRQTRLAAIGFSIFVHAAVAGLAGFLVVENRISGQGAVFRSFDVSIELEQQHRTGDTADEVVREPDPRKPDSQPITDIEVVGSNVGGGKKEKQRPEKRPVKAVREQQRTAEPTQPEQVKSIASSPVESSENSLPTHFSETDRQDYLSRLQAHVEAHKYYPRRARQLGIEGSVVVSFQLDAGGRITGLTSDGAHRLLNQSAARSVKQAVPMPVPPGNMVLPLTVNLTMRYDLQR